MSNDDEKGSDKEPISGPWGKTGQKGKPTSEDKSPWGKSRGPFTDPDANKKLEETLDVIQKRFKESFGGGGGSGGGSGSNFPSSGMPGKGIIFGVTLVAAALWLSTGFFRVQENQMGVVMRFGKMVRVVSAGLQYRLPYPIETVEIRSGTVTEITSATKGEKHTDSDPTLILTGDENMVHCNYKVLWRIKDIQDFLFSVKNPEATIKAAANSVTREVIGQTLASSALMGKKEEIATQAQTLLQKLMDQYKLGVEIVAYKLTDVDPPKEVENAYNDVQASRVDAEQERNKAESYRNDIIPRAKGAAFQIVQDSEAYRDAKIAEASGEASRFKAVYEAYSKNKSIAITRFYQDAMQTVLSKTNKVLFDPKVSQGVLPYLPLNDLKKSEEKTDGDKK